MIISKCTWGLILTLLSMHIFASENITPKEELHVPKSKSAINQEYPFVYKINDMKVTNVQQSTLLKKYFDPSYIPEKALAKNITTSSYNITSVSSFQRANFLLSGFAEVSFEKTEGRHSSFGANRFDPIFIASYKDLLIWRSQLEFTIDGQGTTDTTLEYSYFDFHINPKAIIVLGKFLYPGGKFFNSLYLPWQNKLPTAPVGFDENGAAPEADIGLQLRGNFQLSDYMSLNYTIFVLNGPEMVAEIDGPEMSSLGFPVDVDGHKIIGTRIGYFLIPQLEIGISGSSGKVGLFVNDIMVGEPRDYYLLGTDINFNYRDFDLRGEFIEQHVDSSSPSSFPNSAKWAAGYIQAAYKFLPPHWEGIVRYSNFSSANAGQTQSQWAFGLNYWIAPTILIKCAYEMNQGKEGTFTDANQFLINFVFGF